ncbi:glycoside hydrolase family 16 protein [Virgisporangium aurantiacum]|nr:glycoside hydrolase family 16 protein [Virgisporangium aurantiacum]
MSLEPVQVHVRRKTLSVGALAAVLILGVATPAAATDPANRTPVTLNVAAPAQGATVHDTTTVTFTGTNLRAVTVYRFLDPVGTAAVTADGTAATVDIDTTRFRNGTVHLTAYGYGAGSSRPRAARTVKLTVDNATGDRHLPGYRLIYGDEFGGRTLDRSKWCTRYQYDGGTESPEEQAKIHPGCLGRDPATGTTLGTLDSLGIAVDEQGNPRQGQEDQVYRDVNTAGRTMHTVRDGFLSMHATPTFADPRYPFLKYESAMIRSKREFQPTAEHPLYITARVRQPDVIGSWPAFWLNGGYGDGHVRPPWPPEIDILEGVYNGVGNNANMVWTAVQTWPYSWADAPQGPVSNTYTHPQFDGNSFVATESLKNRWIEMAIEWHPDRLCLYLDGLKFRCTNYTWVAADGPANTNPATILLNLGVGGPWAGSNGVDVAKLPTDSYDVDHVRVYRK